MIDKPCLHNWKPLYQEPTDPDFLKIYDAAKLGRIYQCEKCGAIAKERSNGKIRPLAQKHWEGHLTRSGQWSENLNTFAISQGEES